MTTTMQSAPTESAARTRRSSRWIVASLPVLLIIFLVGYRSTRSTDPWEPTIKKAGQAATSPFGRTVLGDGSISRDEYARANSLVVECARAKGVTFHLEDRHGLSIFSSAGSNEAATLDQCESGDLAVVRSLYEEWYKDPRREGDIVYRRCLEGAGFAVPTAAPGSRSIDDAFDKAFDNSGSADFSKAEACYYDPAGHSKK